MKTNTSVFVVIIAILVLAAALWFFWAQKPLSAVPLSVPQETIKIGASLPLTGSVANLGVSAKNAIEMAVTETNNQGGINGKRLEVTFEDDQCDAKEAVTTVTKLMTVDGRKIIISPYCSSAALAVAPIAEKNKVLLLSGSATNPKLSDYPLYFRTIPSDAYQGKIAAEYAFNSLGKRKAAIEYAQNDYAVGLRDVFKKRFSELGGTIVGEAEHAENATDLRTQIEKIRSSDAELLYLVPYPTDGGNFLKQAKELGLSMPILGPDTLETPQIIELARDGAEGIQYTVAKEEKNEDFRSKYNAAYQSEPLIYAVNYYDAIKILVSAMNRCGEDVDCLRDFLVNMPVYNGASGPIQFDSHGDLLGREFIIKTIQNGQFVPLQGS